jgi:LuxR family maltose regulon positive regulatory protein
MLALKAILYKVQGNMKEATAVMAQAVVQAEPGSLVRIFLDRGPTIYPIIREVALSGQGLEGSGTAYIQRLLKACEAEWGPLNPDQTEMTVSPLVDPLTEREREVLAFIAAGLSNREIEERLFISRNTVRTHIKNLYSKLGVNDREGAREQAQFLGLT